MICAECKYWLPLSVSGEVAREERHIYKWPIGECRRFPPSFDCTDQSSWPTSNRYNWCGEFQAYTLLVTGD